MGYSTKELIIELKRSEKIQLQQQAMIKELQMENDHLSATISNKELGLINEERHELNQKVFICEARERKAIKDLESYINEQEEKSAELSDRLDDVKKKQEDTDRYIKKEAAKIAKAKKRELSASYSEKEKSLKSEYKEKEALIQNKLIMYRYALGFTAAYAIITTLLLFAWR